MDKTNLIENNKFTRPFTCVTAVQLVVGNLIATYGREKVRDLLTKSVDLGLSKKRKQKVA